MTVAAMIEGLRAMEARNAKLEAENAALRAQVSAAGEEPDPHNPDGLRACPFCASLDVASMGTMYVRCRVCDANGPAETDDADGATLWNTRR